MGAAYGSCGERCMAIPVLVAVGDATADAVVAKLRDALARQALAVMAHPSLAPLFGQKSRAEVALAGQIEVMGRNIPIIGRIDRLAETDTGVIIADFKTGAPPKGDMPASYTLQLALYRAAVARLYPDRTVRALLVWTDGPQVIELDEASAAEALEGLG